MILLGVILVVIFLFLSAYILSIAMIQLIVIYGITYPIILFDRILTKFRQRKIL